MMERIGKIGALFQKIGGQNRRINTTGTLRDRESLSTLHQPSQTTRNLLTK